ncbi:disease resistance protein RPV1-like [Eucalyptus grandis]|uniref:disease resistance protein RPV1-like n=1 Tax=Eucalyptus grandis TaxID=71139 RepID=UPI00192F0D0F|nr:disease resistance protein RPV1-like [Eucalyptus grandis]
MASSDEGMSSGFEYQVFLSFKRSDTCHGFTDFLFHSLIDAGIYVFQNNKELRVGERINGLLQQVINNSKIYIPIFSQNYASSQQCLGELTQIFSNTSNSKDYKEILPIYFGVEPNDVRLKTVLYSDAILSLQREKELSNEQVDIWRKALMEVGAIKGWEVKKYNGHGEIIKLIAEEVTEKLKVKHRLMSKHLVGVDDHVVSVFQLLDIDSDDVRLIKIYGMGGIGKTTLAKVIFNEVCSHFGEYSYFLEDIREKSSRANGLIELQKKFLDKIDYRAGTSSIDEIDHGVKRIEEALHNKKVLLQELCTETLDKLRRAPPEDVFEKLKISYDALSYEHQQIFLDIACFFIGEDTTNAIHMWRDCRFFPVTGVDVLRNMRLVEIRENNEFWMHDQLRDFGREIVRRENPINPGKRSRIWIWEEVLHVLNTEKINKKVEALYFERNPLNSHNIIVQIKEIGRTNMYLNNIVVLEYTGVDSLDDLRLRDIIKRARKLKVLYLKSCHGIMRTPDFFGCPNLERLNFEDCSNLKRIDGSIGNLKYLTDLKIDRCFCLKDLPEEIGDLENLKNFFVQRCKVKKLLDSIWKLKSLRELHFSSCFLPLVSADLWELPSAIGMLPNLEVLLVNIPNLKGELPSGIEVLPILRILNLSNTQISEVPKTISMLPHLQKLELMACHNIQELPALPTSLNNLRMSSASLRAIPDLSYLTNLVQLDLMIVDEEEINFISISDGGLGSYSN